MSVVLSCTPCVCCFWPQSAESAHPTRPCHTRWLVLAGGWHLLLLLWVLSWPAHVVILATAKWSWGAACVLPLSFLSWQPEGLYKHCQRLFFLSCSWLAAWEVPSAALHTYMLMCCALTTYSSPSRGCRRVRSFLSSLFEVGVRDSPLVDPAAPFRSCGPFAT